MAERHFQSLPMSTKDSPQVSQKQTKLRWLGQKICGAELKISSDLGGVAARGVDHHGYVLEYRMGFDVLKEFFPIHLRHIDIKEYVIGKFGLFIKFRQGLFTIVCYPQFAIRFYDGHRFAEYILIVLIIVHQQYDHVYLIILNYSNAPYLANINYFSGAETRHLAAAVRNNDYSRIKKLLTARIFGEFTDLFISSRPFSARISPAQQV